MRNFISVAALLLGALVFSTAFAGPGHGHGGGMMMSSHNAAFSSASLGARSGGSANAAVVNTHSNHGATVSVAAHAAQSSGMKVGPQVRSVARTNAHASRHTHPVNHGADVSAAAHTAQASGMKVGPQVRDVARKNAKTTGKANGTKKMSSQDSGGDDTNEADNETNEVDNDNDPGKQD